MKTKPKFDRYTILTTHYAKEIGEQWNFDAIKRECEKNAEYEEENPGTKIGYCYLGSVLSMSPSGKYYTCWTSNQTNSDVTRDNCFWEVFERALEKNGLFLGGPDSGDGCDVFAGMVVDDDKTEGDETE